MTDQPRRVLVVEGDYTTGEFIRDYLTEMDYEVTVARTVDVAMRYIERNGFPHIMLAEAHVSVGLDGLALCEELQQGANLLPIIIMGSYDHTDIVKRCLRAADDYVLKPIEDGEVLLLRMENILRRFHDFSYAGHPPIRLSDRLSLDPVRRCVVVEGEITTLTPIELGLLMTLLKHRGKAVNSSTLIANAWLAADEVYTDTLRVHIHRLRKKIELEADAPQVIVTERGIGYSLRI